jgi:capsular exopolysaccharide synthesis family protein
MVTSTNLAEGKSITVANLGLVMAQAGLKTIIVDTDLRRPIQHEIFETPNLGGLTDWLCSPGSELKHHLRKTGVENLQLLTSGALPPHPAEMLGSRRMGQLLASLNEVADVVIYDSPPVLAVTDAAVLANRVDGVVLVIKAKQTRRDAARQAILVLHQAGANLLGGVLNQVSKKRGGYYYQTYYSSNKAAATDQPSPARRQPKRRWQWLLFFR